MLFNCCVLTLQRLCGIETYQGHSERFVGKDLKGNVSGKFQGSIPDSFEKHAHTTCD